MKRNSELYVSRIARLRNGLIKEIRFLLELNNLTEIEIPETIGDITYVIWFDKNGYPSECGVTRVILERDHITVVAKDNESEDEHEMDSRYHLGARNIDWLNNILENIENILLKDNNVNSNTIEQ